MTTTRRAGAQTARARTIAAARGMLVGLALAGSLAGSGCIPIIVGAAAGSHAAKMRTREELFAAGQLTGKGQWQTGITLGDGLVITHVDPNGPAAAAGVMVGDKLLRVDGDPLQPPQRAELMLYGDGDEKVWLDVARSEELLQFKMRRRYLPGTEPPPYVKVCPPPWEDLQGKCDPKSPR